ncbi:hypothetical protein FXO38_17519 [Capsicum annuum]|nr:hypothetical protein FXO38_17519 [Capsicum annuum]
MKYFNYILVDNTQRAPCTLQQLLPVSTDWLKEHNHLLASTFDVDRLKVDREHRVRCSRSPVLGTKDGLVSGVPIQRPGLNFNAGSFWQLNERKEEPRGESRVQYKSGLQKGVSNVVGSCPSAVQEQKGNDRLVLPASLMIGVVCASLMNETMPCRHKGQGIEPGGPWATVDVLLVEHRYNAQRVQNS